MTRLYELTRAMIAFNDGDPKRIQHLVKVHSFAKLIGEGEGLDERTLLTLEAAALVHDIGIRPAERKFGRCNGKLQEQEGPQPARELLTRLGFDTDMTERVAYLVGHHHTYQNVDGLDYRILLEADFLVNMYEDELSLPALEAALEAVFETKTGRDICRTMFLPAHKEINP